MGLLVLILPVQLLLKLLRMLQLGVLALSVTQMLHCTAP